MSRLVSANFYDWETTKNERFPDLVTPYGSLSPWLASNATRVVTTSLQPIRDVVGRVRVLGFYRDPILNDAVDGIPGSLHLDALAADWIPIDADADDVWRLLRDGLVPGISFDHLNFYSTLDVPSFHVDHRPLEAGPPRMKLYENWNRWAPTPEP